MCRKVLTGQPPHTTPQRRILKLNDRRERRTDAQPRHALVALDDLAADLLRTLRQKHLPLFEILATLAATTQNLQGMLRLDQKD
jgi:hypothetical protein